MSDWYVSDPFGDGILDRIAKSENNSTGSLEIQRVILNHAFGRMQTVDK